MPKKPPTAPEPDGAPEERLLTVGLPVHLWERVHRAASRGSKYGSPKALLRLILSENLERYERS